jgi:hypothetical protein
MPEDGILHFHRRENLKSYKCLNSFLITYCQMIYRYMIKIISTFKTKVVSLSPRYGTPRLLDVVATSGHGPVVQLDDGYVRQLLEVERVLRGSEQRKMEMTSGPDSCGL